MKQCNKCEEYKALDCFSNSCKSKDGKDYCCKACAQAYKKQHYSQNKAQIIEKARRYQQDNSEKISQRKREHYQTNKDRISAQKSLYKKANRALFNAAAARRKAAQIKATPVWMNPSKVAGFYETAQGLSMLLGEWYHVDHIVPLISDFVCGLHCEANLRVITAKENLSKSNLWWPDMPEEFAPNITEET